MEHSVCYSIWRSSFSSVIMIKVQNEWAFIYWYFNHNGILVRDDRNNPIIPSIASLRYWNPSIDIFVIDVSKAENDWEDYPEQFRFKVIKQDSVYHNIYQKSDFLGPVSLELLGKTHDVWSLCQTLGHERFAVLDSDLFWMQDPLPLYGGDKVDFYISSDGNTGFYYHHKDAEDFVYLWRGLNNMAVYEEKFRKMISQKSKHKPIQEEAVFNYAAAEFGCTLRRCPITENYTTSCYSWEGRRRHVQDIKVLHILTKNCPKFNNVAIVQSITEIRLMMEKMFDPKQYKFIFKNDPLADVSYKDVDGMIKLLV